MTNKTFWNIVKSFMTNKGILSDDKIIIVSEHNVKINLKKDYNIKNIKRGDVINDEEILVEMFNHDYVNIVENSTGVAPSELGTPSDPNLDSKTVEEILKHYENYPSIKEIKKLVKKNETFTFPKAKTEDINKIINLLNSKTTVTTAATVADK